LQKTSVEAVTRSNGIDWLNWKSRHAKTLAAVLGNCALRPHLMTTMGDKA